MVRWGTGLRKGRVTSSGLPRSSTSTADSGSRVMLARDGVIEKIFSEPQVEGDPYEVSDADTMLRYLDPEARPVPQISLFTRSGCRHCELAAYFGGRGLFRGLRALLGAEGSLGG